MSNYELQRAAMIDGDWGPYLAFLHEEGGRYAASGMEYDEWLEVNAAIRRAVLDDLLPPASPLRDDLIGMDAFFSLVAGAMSNAYVAAKQRVVHSAQAELSLYIETFSRTSLGLVIYRLDVEGDPGTFRLVAANPAAVAINPPLAGIGRSLLELFPDFVAAGGADSWLGYVGAAEPASWTADYAGRIYDAHGVALPDRHLCLIYEDVTETRRLEREVESYVVSLERSNKELDEFAYITSHDLRAPLQDVKNLAQWVAEDAGAALPEGSRRHLGLLRDRIVRMERLLDDLLDYSRIGRGQQEAGTFTFGDVVDEVLGLVTLPPGSSATITGRENTFAVPRAPLEKVLRNLVSNALKHHDREVVALELSARAVGARIEISVADDGPGIPPEYHERAFRIFQTLKPRDQVEGSGIGLAIVKKTVESYGGTVAVRSVGRGTRFLLSWPARWPETDKSGRQTPAKGEL